ncbi:Gfo/Idh/MocA family protein [Actinoplanes sp. N902-109]|uniref:Gfo/Idh/MocA family protein n=1 Tax=Actinoplanes sp. (strain N902-109) TaxID=649831 RepID=UPI0003294113|nr:Gfo/Idh/MocA family oxidoreductase [Actinoplanes sp. N902-109]AGL17294.1 oxidoreductase domain-containing protein [Actinoplanes sp. N902-109]
MATVALIGANGHGRHHRRVLATMPGVRLIAVADPQPVDPDPPLAPYTGVFTDHRRLLAEAEPDVVIICTPPHTHLPIAIEALQAGADVLLEKPPVQTLAEHHALLAVLHETGRICQVGFQALGSRAATLLWDNLPGQVATIAAAASWQRNDAYYARAPWAGRRRVDGRPVIDGVLVNPLAHALMQCLATASAAISHGAITPPPAAVTAVPGASAAASPGAAAAASPGAAGTASPGAAGAASPGAAGAASPGAAGAASPGASAVASGAGGVVEPVVLEIERYRVRDIEADDTTFARIRCRTGPNLLLAVTLAGEDFIAGDIIVTGTEGRATLEYPTDRLQLPCDPKWHTVEGRTDLLRNLLAHRADPGVPLLAPLSRTAPFTAVLEGLTGEDLPPPTLLGPEWTDTREDGTRVIRGINAVIRAAADRQALPSELGIPWAVPPHRRTLPTT